MLTTIPKILLENIFFYIQAVSSPMAGGMLWPEIGPTNGFEYKHVSVEVEIIYFQGRTFQR